MATEIKYNGSVIASPEAGQTATLKCQGMKMETDVVVEVGEQEEVLLQEKTITENGDYFPDEGYDGFSEVTVNVPIPSDYVKPTGTKKITENGTHDVTSYAQAEVEIPDPVLQEKTVTENGEVTPDAGYDGLSKVTVAVESSGGSPAINGIIKQYKVNTGATIDAGDFVEFVNKCGAGEFHTGATSYLSACKLDDSRVLVAYMDGGNSNYGTAVVLSIDGGIITVGAEKIFHNAKTSYISVASLPSGKALVVYYGNQSSTKYCRARILITDGITITTLGTECELYDRGIYSTSVTALSDSLALVAYGYGPTLSQSYGGTITRLTISGNTISKGNNVSICTGTSSSYAPSTLRLTKITETKAMLSAYYNSAYKLHIISVDGNSLSLGSSPSVNSYWAAVLSDTLAIRVFNASDSPYDFSATPLSISGTSIKQGTTVALCGKVTSLNGIAALSENKALVTFGGQAMVISMDGENISAGAPAIFTNATSISNVNIVSFSAASVLITFVGDGVGMYASLSIDGDIITVADASGTYVQPVTGRWHNVAVAATSGTSGEMVDVYVAGIKRSGFIYENYYTSSAKEITSGTTLTASVNCSVGDLVVAAIATRDTLTLSDGWTLVSTSDVNSADTAGNGQRLSWAWKFAESTTESITVTQAIEQRLYINMVALQGATGVIDNGYSYRDDATGGSMTVDKPDGLVLWGATAPNMSAGLWSMSNNVPVIQLGTSDTTRLIIGLDQTDVDSVTIASRSTATTMIVGSLSVQGMDKFYTATPSTWLE